MPAPVTPAHPASDGAASDGPATDDGVTAALGRALGGAVRELHLLSGGASRLTSSFVHVAGDGTTRRLVLQRDRGSGLVGPGRVLTEVALLRAAGAAGVPVPEVVAFGHDPAEGLGPGWLVVGHLAGETIPRKILRDPEWAEARAALTGQCAAALAGIHALDPAGIVGLPDADPLRDPLALLDAMGEVRPALEFGARWLERHRPPPVTPVPLHGDFRLGNLLVGPDGLRAVLDWELAHAGDPAEDLAWLCAPAWRFGGPGAVGGFGEVTTLLDAYVAAGGEVIEPGRLHWWIVYATVKWAVICALQAASHLSGATRSVELAAIGRRVCESEWDLCVLLGVAPEAPGPADLSAPTPAAAAEPPAVLAPFGRPSAAELVDAVQEYLGRDVMEQSAGRAGFQARIARNVLALVGRELELGPTLARAHGDRLDALGFESDRELAAAIRAGDCDDDWPAVGAALAASARAQLLVANPSYL
jgi:aminoglycoside phosphotransferase (APT) family kinase protein